MKNFLMSNMSSLRNAMVVAQNTLQDIPPPSSNVSIFYSPFTYMIHVGVTETLRFHKNYICDICTKRTIPLKAYR
jgi:hypothetical protein